MFFKVCLVAMPRVGFTNVFVYTYVCGHQVGKNRNLYIVNSCSVYVQDRLVATFYIGFSKGASHCTH